MVDPDAATANCRTSCGTTISSSATAADPASAKEASPEQDLGTKRRHCDLASSNAAAAAGPSAMTIQTRSVRRRLTRTSWEQLLPADLVGTLGTFLDSESVVYLAISAGPVLSRVIKKAYLRRNFSLLEKNSYGKKKCAPLLFRAFLEANDDWRDMYDNPRLLSPSDQEGFDTIFRHIQGFVMYGPIEIVKHAIEVRGLNINAVCVHGPGRMPLFFYAVFARNLPVLEYLLSINELAINVKGNIADGMIGVSALHMAMNQDEVSLPILQLLLSRFDINVNIASDVHGSTPLHFAACRKNSSNLLPLLLSHEDININATNNHGVTPLFFAVMTWCEDKECEGNVKCLINAGSDTNLRDHRNRTLLDIVNKEQAVLIRKWIGERNTPDP